MEQAERDAEIAEILLGMRAAEQAEDVGGGELDVPDRTNEAGAANALHIYISGLQTATTPSRPLFSGMSLEQPQSKAKRPKSGDEKRRVEER
jgi:hypothetical protein